MLSPLRARKSEKSKAKQTIRARQSNNYLICVFNVVAYLTKEIKVADCNFKAIAIVVALKGDSNK